MSRFDRYLLSLLLALFGFFALVLVSVYWVNQAVQLFEQIIADGQSALVFLELSALTLPNVVRLVLPIAGFAAAVYVTNRLTQDSELVVMQATGFSPWQLARPAAYFALCLAVMLSILTHVLVPQSRAELADRRAEIAANVTARFLVEGSFQHPAKGLTLYIRDIAANGELQDLYLSDLRDPAQRTTYTAERALILRADTGPKLLMFRGMAQSLRQDSQRLSVTRFEDFVFDIGALVPSSSRVRRDLRELSTPRLLRASPADQALTGAAPPALRAEAHARIAQPLMAGSFALIGFAALLTGGFSRFGTWRQIGLAVLALVAVQMLANLGDAAAERDARAWPMVYLPVLAGLALAAVLLWWAGRPRRRRKQSETGDTPDDGARP